MGREAEERIAASDGNEGMAEKNRSKTMPL